MKKLLFVLFSSVALIGRFSEVTATESSENHGDKTEEILVSISESLFRKDQATLAVDPSGRESYFDAMQQVYLNSMLILSTLEKARNTFLTTTFYQKAQNKAALENRVNDLINSYLTSFLARIIKNAVERRLTTKVVRGILEKHGIAFENPLNGLFSLIQGKTILSEDQKMPRNLHLLLASYIAVSNNLGRVAEKKKFFIHITKKFLTMLKVCNGKKNSYVYLCN